jgi:hypothetical protein
MKRYLKVFAVVAGSAAAGKDYYSRASIEAARCSKAAAVVDTDTDTDTGTVVAWVVMADFAVTVGTFEIDLVFADRTAVAALVIDTLANMVVAVVVAVAVADASTSVSVSLPDLQLLE